MQTTTKQFDFVVLDTPLQPFGGHYEHFELFPALFRVLSNSAIIVLNIVPEIDRKALDDYPGVFSDSHLRKRAEFYRTTEPEKLSVQEMVDVYERVLRQAGFALNWFFLKERTILSFLVLKVTRNLAAPEAPCTPSPARSSG